MATQPTPRRAWLTPKHIQTACVFITAIVLVAGDAPARITMAAILVLLHSRLQRAVVHDVFNRIMETLERERAIRRARRAAAPHTQASEPAPLGRPEAGEIS